MTENLNGNGNGNERGRRKKIIDYVRDYIDQRIRDVEENPDIVRTGRITLSTIFYHIRKLLEGDMVPLSRSTRRTISHDYIRSVCDERGYKRAELGIIASVRAEFYFRGEYRNVGIDSIGQLVKDGTDIVIIEKEGIVEALAPFADMCGVALMYTRGFAVEYARELSEKTEANVVLVTDFDASGIIIAVDLPDIPRIGIDFEALEDLFDSDSVVTEDSEIVKELEEIYEQAPPKEGERAKKEDTHLISLLKSGNPYIKYFIPDLNSKKRRRIEIDSVLKAVGNERFWNFIIYRLDQLYRLRNYLRAIDVDKIANNIYTPEMYEFQTLVVNMINNTLKNIKNKTKKDLENYTGFIENIDSAEDEIRRNFANKRDKDKTLNELRKDVIKLIKKYKKKK
jgi:hypothetical protein